MPPIRKESDVGAAGATKDTIDEGIIKKGFTRKEMKVEVFAIAGCDPLSEFFSVANTRTDLGFI